MVEVNTNYYLFEVSSVKWDSLLCFVNNVNFLCVNQQSSMCFPFDMFI